jgi:hypothetical protein
MTVSSNVLLLRVGVFFCLKEADTMKALQEGSGATALTQKDPFFLCPAESARHPGDFASQKPAGARHAEDMAVIFDAQKRFPYFAIHGGIHA